jgi:DNA polymerase
MSSGEWRIDTGRPLLKSTLPCYPPVEKTVGGAMDDRGTAREERFAALTAEATSCLRCERMRDRVAVLGPRNGSLRPRVLFLAEAPGRNGADRTRIPFSGDKSGENFETLLASIDLRREEIFITNSVLCSPRKASGANDKPTLGELRNCSDLLRRQVELLDPPIVVTLGAVALAAIKRIEPHSFQLQQHAARIVPWHGRRLIPLYHPSPQVLITSRSLAAQLEDYRSIRAALAEIEAISQE